MNRSARSPLPSSLLTDLLEALGESKVSQDPLDLAAVAPDASHYLLTPSVLVRAGSTSDVAAAMAAAKRHKVAVNFRSGGTSLSGQGLTNGVMVDTRRSFRGIEVLDGGRKVRVQPGATIVAVNSVLARYGRKLGPDPASSVACTLGGVLADNSSGMSCGTVANSYRTLDSMVFVLASGTVIDTADPQCEDKRTNWPMTSPNSSRHSWHYETNAESRPVPTKSLSNSRARTRWVMGSTPSSTTTLQRRSSPTS